MNAFVAVFTAVLASSEAFLTLNQCSNVSGIDNFDSSRYVGVWYEYSNLFEIFQIGGKCVRATYTAKDDGTIGVKNEQVNQWFNTYAAVTGSARIADPDTPNKAELFVTFDSVPSFGGTPSTGKVDPNYILADTDYDNYAIVYSCSRVFFATKESLWILTRAQVPDQSIVDTAYQKAKDLGLPVDRLRKTVQDGCTALP